MGINKGMDSRKIRPVTGKTGDIGSKYTVIDYLFYENGVKL
jgi:hypothetical protein